MSDWIDKRYDTSCIQAHLESLAKKAADDYRAFNDKELRLKALLQEVKGDLESEEDLRVTAYMNVLTALDLLSDN